MSLLGTSFPEDAQVVLAEVLGHLLELDARPIDEPVELARAWAEVHGCDDAVLDALDTADRPVYQAALDTTPPRPRRPRRLSDPIVQERAVRLHLAVHRRVVVLRDLVPATG